MDRDRLIKRLMPGFLDELAEHIGALNRDLLALEKEPEGLRRGELLQTLFRTAHSLKGAARSVSVEAIEGACHQVEEILGAARDGRAYPGPDVFALLFKTIDAIEEAAMRLREQQDLRGSPLVSLLPNLEEAAGRVIGLPVPTTPPALGRAGGVSPLVLHAPEGASTDQGAYAPRSPPPAELPGEPAGGSVRVAAEKLDAFLARNGELLVARRRVASRADDLAALRESVGHWSAEWRTAEKALAKWLRRSADDGDARLPRRIAAVLERTGETLRRVERDLDRLTATVAVDHRQLAQAAEALDGELRRVRMLPFADACAGLDRVVRDVARAGGKEAELVVEGGTVELDRSILEGLKDPLRHLVRNSVDHGIEPPDERIRSGKAPQARVTVTAVFRGTQVEVAVADDGRGIDLDAVRQQLRRKGLPEAADERELARSIFLPGFSTARFVTDVSGRGVGLDVVKGRVEALHGTVDLTFAPGRGTRFTLAVPLTLTTLRALLVEAGGQTFALAGTNVRKLVRVGSEDFVALAGRPALRLGETPLPVASLAETLGLRGGAKSPAGRKPAVIVAAGEKRMAFVVDELLAEQEVVIKNLGPRVRRVRQVSGATLLPSGRIALVLNAANLIRTALARAPAAVPGEARPEPLAAKRRILVADDSVTTRALEKSILEAAGYEVTTAADGAAAWQLLRERGADLLVSDVEMPRMDGFALTEAVRGSERFRGLPVVLVTARESDRDKARGAEVGADAYLVKSAFDQRNLLETIAQLL